MANLDEVAEQLLELADLITDVLSDVEKGELSAEAALSCLQYHPQLIAQKAMLLKAHVKFSVPIDESEKMAIRDHLLSNVH